VLNLSCNKIAQISGLKAISGSLKVLNLSHNRVLSLQHIGEIASTSTLEVLDLTDNCIGDPSQLRCLQGLRFLRELAFRKIDDPSKGSNPICDLPSYAPTVARYASRIERLDGESKPEGGFILEQSPKATIKHGDAFDNVYL